MKLFLDGPVGKLEASLEPASHPIGSVAVVCHPHPVHGGTMHNRVVVRIARALVRHGVDVLRFNFRGAGESEGSYDAGVGEQADFLAALDFLKQQKPNAGIILAGFSFGSWVAFKAGASEPNLRALVGVGMPLTHFDFDFLAGCEAPKIGIQGEFDEFGPRRAIEDFWDRLKEPKSLTVIRDADHFFTDHITFLEQTLDTELDRLLKPRHG